MGLTLARPTLCRGGGGAGPGFRGDFPTLCPCPTAAGFESAPLHRPCCLSDKDSAPREGTASEVDGVDEEGRRAGFEGVA